MPVGGAGNWRSAFLPGVYQGTYVDTSKEDPRALIADVHNARMNRGAAVRPLSLPSSPQSSSRPPAPR